MLSKVVEVDGEGRVVCVMTCHEGEWIWILQGLECEVVKWAGYFDPGDADWMNTVGH